MRSRVLEPPYCYRWAVLIAVVTAVIVGGVMALRSEPSVAAPEVVAAPRPEPVASPAILRQRDTDDRVVALTFDDGPHPDYTAQVLKLLAEHDAVATFCMIGTQATRFPELVREVADAGMRLCNHTRSHHNLTEAAPEAMAQEILDGRADLRTAVGAKVPIPYFRAPGGFWSPSMCEIAARNGMAPLAWSVDPHDWQQPGAGQILESLKRAIHPGAVILLHDGGGKREQTVAALAQLLPWLADNGYRLGFPD